MHSAWIMLIIAGLLEVGWAIGLKASEGFTRPLPSVLTLLAMAASFFLLARAMQVLPVGTAMPSGSASVRWAPWRWASSSSAKAPRRRGC